jgi:hypothetical protein
VTGSVPSFRFKFFVADSRLCLGRIRRKYATLPGTYDAARAETIPQLRRGMIANLKGSALYGPMGASNVTRSESPMERPLRQWSAISWDQGTSSGPFCRNMIVAASKTRAHAATVTGSAAARLSWLVLQLRHPWALDKESREFLPLTDRLEEECHG